MPFARPLLVVLCAAQAGDAVLAAPAIAPAPAGEAPIIEPVQRKGTRAYKSDGTQLAPADAAPAKAPSGDDALAQCIATWDAGTHISPSKWREICVRQLRDRDSMYR